MTIERDCRDLALRQGGVVRRDQVLELGMTSRMIERRLASGDWTLVTRGVYRLFAVADPRRLVEAAVAALPGAVVSHESAAALHRFPLIPDTPPTVTVHSSTTHSFPGVTVRRTRDLARHHVEQRAGLPVTTVPRTVVDLAAIYGERRLSDLVDELVASSRLGWSALVATIDEVARPGKRGSALLRRLVEDRAEPGMVVATRLERRGLAVLRAGGLAPPAVQMPIPWAPDRRWDAAYPAERVAIEWDSRRWHTRREDFQSDRERDREAAAHGWIVLRFTWEDLQLRPDRVVEEIRTVLELRGSVAG